MDAPDIVVRTMTENRLTDKHGNTWQYHSQSDGHSKAACWGMLFDLMQSCEPFRRHASQGRIVFGVNHRLVDFSTQKRKNLDLVVSTPGEGQVKSPRNMASLADHYNLKLTHHQRAALADLPALLEGPTGQVLIALEAKAAMTAHIKALPRLFDELNSSHQIVHGHSAHAISAGFVMINAAPSFASTSSNEGSVSESTVRYNTHALPKDVLRTMEAIQRIPRRTKPGESGYDALGVVVVEAENSPIAHAPWRVSTAPPAPQPGDSFHYDDMLARLCHEYGQRFGGI